MNVIRFEIPPNEGNTWASNTSVRGGNRMFIHISIREVRTMVSQHDVLFSQIRPSSDRTLVTLSGFSLLTEKVTD